MKFSMVCVVFAAFAAVAAPVRAILPVSTTASTLGDTFFRLIKTQSNIKTVEKQNNDYVSQALNNISRVLNQGLDSEISHIGNQIHNTLVNVNLKVGQISGNATSMISQIDSVALTIGTLKFSDARLDYTMKKNRIKTLCKDTLAMTNVLVQLIDETMELLSTNVSGPLKMLELTIQLASKNRLLSERTDIAYQQSIIDNPPSTWLLSKDYNALNAAEALKQQSSDTIERIQKLVTLLLSHTKWLEIACQTIRNDLENYRTTISATESKISGASGSISMIAEKFDFLLTDNRNMSNNDLMEGSKALVQLMTNLRDQVVNDMITKPYQNAPEDFTRAVYTQQQQLLKPLPRDTLWLEKIPVDNCLYIYNNGTLGCISVTTFDYMKVQYTWLVKTYTDYESLFKANEKKWNNITTELLNVSKNIPQWSELIKFVADLETKKHLWRANIQKIRDLSVKLNYYAETLFSEGNAKLNATRGNDENLNKDIKRVVDEINFTAMNIMKEITYDVLNIKDQEVNIRRYLPFQD